MFGFASAVLAAAVTLISSPSGQMGQAAAGGAISGAIKQTWDGAKLNIRESADQMPETTYGFKPVDSVRTFGQIIAHIAGTNYVFCAAARGETPPHGEDAFEMTAKTKAEIVKALDGSLAYCDVAYTSLNDSAAGEAIALPFGMSKGPRAFVLMANTGHLNEHYGNLVTYFRIKGMVPPSTAREQRR